MKCYACGKLVSILAFLVNFVDTLKGHISRDCPAPNGGPLNSAGKVCYKCGVAGHISRDCSAAEANGTVGIDGNMDGVAPAAPAAVV